MLFNSHIFLFGFLPVVLLLFFGLGALGRPRLALASLFVSSLFFYGWWNTSYLTLIASSVVFNYLVGLRLGARGRGAEVGAPHRRALLVLGVAGNLGALGYFKYANFFVDTFNQLSGSHAMLAPIVLPLAISFFTFQQIAYLADAYRDRTGEPNFLNYCVFVTFFPQLIAGPIVHHREMLPQFRDRSIYGLRAENLVVGATIFFLGLFKKVILADGIAVYSTPVFDAASAGNVLTTVEAWSGALAYTLQLYFDFSGYSDMAVGLGRLFGIRLPINFDSPYKATSIIDFWRRWHMTLSRFLRDYLYIGLGGNRRGPARRYLNVMITMLLGGLWHGAGWTFVIWGGLHGVYLLINHGWRAFGWQPAALPGARRWGARLLTFGATLVAWVFFRADDFAAATWMLRAMVGQQAAGLPPGWEGSLEPLAFLALLTLIVFAAPNTLEFMGRYEPVIDDPRSRARSGAGEGLRWRPTRTWAVAMAVISVWAVLGINRLSEFLYFQF